MSSLQNTKRTLIEKIYMVAVGIFGVIFSLFIAYVSLMHTTFVEVISDNEVIDSAVYNIKAEIESVIYKNDNFILNIIVLILMIAIMSIFIANGKKFKLQYNLIFIFAWTAILGIIWVVSSQSAPNEDSGVVTNTSWQFAHGNYDMLTDEKERYFRNYPFQLGYVLFNEIIIRIRLIFGEPKNLLFLEVLNGIFLGIINVFVVLINNKLFDDKRVNNITTIILALSVAPMISCSFIYGIFPGMCFAIVALYCQIKYIKENKKLYAILSLLLITVAIIIKPNYIIWVIAMVCIYVVAMFKDKKFIFKSICVILSVVFALSAQSVVKASYEKRAGVDLGDSIPYVSYIAMGLNESNLAPGWYNYAFTMTNFETSNFNTEVASKSSKKVIKDRIIYFAKHPQYTDDFFYLKETSQWNETSYESIWNNQVRGQYKDKNAFAAWVCGGCEFAVKKYMDYIAQFSFVMFLIGMIAVICKKDYLKFTFPLIFVGGFMYHTISEGKSQYIMPYFILICGFAAIGMVSLYDKLSERLPDKKFFKVLFLPNPEVAVAESTKNLTKEENIGKSEKINSTEENNSEKDSVKEEEK